MAFTQTFRVAGACLDHLKALGYEASDQEASDDLASELSEAGKDPVSPPLNHEESYLSEADCRWVVLRHEGAVVGCVGARYYSSEETPFSTHLERSYSQHYGPGTRVTLRSATRKRLGEIQGPFIYSGDCWFKSGHRGDISKTVSFCHLAFSVFFMKWPRARLLYAMHWRPDGLRGKIEQYGFVSGSLPAVQTWEQAPSNRKDTEHLSMLLRDDFMGNVDFFDKYPDELTEPPIRPR